MHRQPLQEHWRRKGKPYLHIAPAEVDKMTDGIIRLSELGTCDSHAED